MTLRSILDLGDLDQSDLDELTVEIAELEATNVIPSKNSYSVAAWIVRAKLISCGNLQEAKKAA